MGLEMIAVKTLLWIIINQRSEEIIRQFERIKVLEDALNRYVAKFGNCGEVYEQAVKALEVKRE